MDTRITRMAFKYEGTEKVREGERKEMNSKLRYVIL